MSFLNTIPSKLKPWLVFIILLAVFIIINPYSNLDIILLSTALFILGHIFLKEKLLLVFLLLRPALDYWRDYSLFTFRETSFNLNAALSLLFLFWVLLIIWPYIKQIKKPPLIIPAGALILIMFFSTLASVSPLISLFETIKFINIITIFGVTYLLIKNGRLQSKDLLLTLIASAIIPVLLSIIQIFLGTGISTFGIYGRIFGTFGHPNVFAFFILFLLFLHIQYSIILPTDFWKNNLILKRTVFIFLTIILLMTYTRAALVGLLIFLIIIGFLKYRKMLIWLVLSISIFYLTVFPLNHWLTNNTHYNLYNAPVISRLITRNEDADSLAWRQALIIETMPIIRAHIWLGYGYGTFPIVWEANRGLSHQWDDSAEAHNDYLRILLETGLIGLIAYIIFLGQLVWQAIKLWQSNPQKYLYFLAWVTVFLALSVTDNMLHHTPVMWLMWAWWGMVLAKSQ